MDAFSASDLVDLTPEELLAGYTRRIAELSTLIYTSAYLLNQLEKTRGDDPKKVDRIEQVLRVTEVMREEVKTMRTHLKLDHE